MKEERDILKKTAPVLCQEPQDNERLVLLIRASYAASDGIYGSMKPPLAKELVLDALLMPCGVAAL